MLAQFDERVTATARAPWQEDLRDLVADGPTLARALGWPELAWAHLPGSGFPLRTTRHYLSLVDPRDPRDPILLQILPALAEDAPPPDGFRLDAVGDLDGPSHPAPGLIQKYPGRALVVTTSHCAVHCRYCFRRHYPYDELREAGPAAAAARTAIAADPSIHEVILSGGDPWSLPDGPFRSLVHSIAQIPHVRRLRVHTRMPVVLPRRVTPELVETLTGTRLRSWVVVHFNHPRELHPDAVDACTRLVEGGVPVLNQSVLLRGVNDDENVLAELCEGLVDIGVKPYYLHQLDRVQATAHWEVPEAEAARIVEQLRVRVSGIAMPQWVRDEPGRRSKTPLW